MHYFIIIAIATLHGARVTGFNQKNDAFITIPNLGRLKGFERDGIFHFLGIRYGQAPVGERRFRAALPERPWLGVRDATRYGDFCPNVQLITGFITGSEDCLFLNVNFKKSKMFGKLPVMVWLHGGAFRNGAGHFPGTGPEFLVQKDVLLVTLNYRTGAFGFVCVDQGAPGNAGIQDQVLALKWVQKNIAYFGGDPTRVTLFGFSAGAISAEILMLSPSSRGLFHHVIAQSGSVLSPWGMAHNPKLQAMRLARALGYWGHISGVVPFLKKAPWRSLAREVRRLTAPTLERNVLDIFFTPCVEEDYGAHMDYDPVMTRHPLEVFATGDYNVIPYMTGITADEGILMLRNDRVDTMVWPKLRNSSTFFIPSDLHLNGLSPWEIKSLARKIGSFYLSGVTDDNSATDALVRYGTDVWFLNGLVRGVQLMLAHGEQKIFMYRFAFEGSFNFYKRFTGYNGRGVSHGDELGYLFAVPFPLLKLQGLKKFNREIQMLRCMLTMWTNFAKTGNPNLGEKHEGQSFRDFYWLPSKSNDDIFYLDINDHMKVFAGFPYPNRLRFWEEIYQRYG